MPAPFEPYAVAKPRRKGVRAKIEALETETKTVSLRKGPAVGVTVLQGDIFRNVTFVEDVFEGQAGILHVPQIVFPHIIVLSQVCDLEHAQWLLSVLAAPLYNAEHVFGGEHLSDLGVETETITRDSTRRTSITRNNEPRYHHLQFPDGVQLPESVIDFRHYFSLNVQYLKLKRRADLAWTVPALWREHISQRFAAFLARIGLPQPVPPPDPAKVQEALRWPKKG